MDKKTYYSLALLCGGLSALDLATYNSKLDKNEVDMIRSAVSFIISHSDERRWDNGSKDMGKRLSCYVNMRNAQMLEDMGNGKRKSTYDDVRDKGIKIPLLYDSDSDPFSTYASFDKASNESNMQIASLNLERLANDRKANQSDKYSGLIYAGFSMWFAALGFMTRKGDKNE